MLLFDVLLNSITQVLLFLNICLLDGLVANHGLFKNLVSLLERNPLHSSHKFVYSLSHFVLVGNATDVDLNVVFSD